MKKINNFLVDFGGVLYQIDESLALKAFFRLSSNPGLAKINSGDFTNYSFFAEYEKGNISSEQFREIIKKEFSLYCSDDEFDKAWNATLISIFPDAEKNITKLKKYGKVVLLSNTNDIHFQKFLPDCSRLFAEFDACFFSHKIGMHKPDRKIYEYAITKMGFSKEETIFIDDSLKNINAAKQFGINTFYINNNKLADVFNILH